MALMIIRDSNPSGSKTLQDSLRTSLFVISEVILGVRDFDVRDNVSICVPHCRPRMLTGLLLFIAWSSSVSRRLLEAQLLRLKSVSSIMQRALL